MAKFGQKIMFWFAVSEPEVPCQYNWCVWMCIDLGESAAWVISDQNGHNWRTVTMTAIFGGHPDSLAYILF